MYKLLGPSGTQLVDNHMREFKSKNMDQFVGVDWASGCWVVVATDGNNVEITTEPSILNVWDRHKKADSILVDIPIGLPETSPRACDERAK